MKKSTDNNWTGTPEHTCGEALFELLVGGFQEENGMVRAEEVVSGAAAIVGERCIEAAGDYNMRDHEFPPGSSVFSDKVNGLLCGDQTDDVLDSYPSQSVLGILRDTLLRSGYQKSEFPPMSKVFEEYANRIGSPDLEWDRVPLSIPEDNLPNYQPLRLTYETRQAVDELFVSLGGDPLRNLIAATLGLAEVLMAIRPALDPRIAMVLALETVNGMSKTAPMTDKAFMDALEPPTKTIN